MKSLCNGLVAASLFGLGVLVSALAHAASGVGPYYATPSWDQTLPAETRFIVLTNMRSEAVLDRETGLVWERSPVDQELQWSTAAQNCPLRATGGRVGWRLPTVQELLSLLEPVIESTPVGPTTVVRLPAGHPFVLPPGPFYWTLTSHNDPTGNKYLVTVGGGFPFALPTPTFQSGRLWCVRSPQGENPQ